MIAQKIVAIPKQEGANTRHDSALIVLSSKYQSFASTFTSCSICYRCFGCEPKVKSPKFATTSFVCHVPVSRQKVQPREMFMVRKSKSRKVLDIHISAIRMIMHNRIAVFPYGGHFHFHLTKLDKR